MNSIDLLQEMVEEFAKKNGYEVDNESFGKLRDVCNEKVEVEIENNCTQFDILKRTLNDLCGGDHYLLGFTVNTESDSDDDSSAFRLNITLDGAKK